MPVNVLQNGTSGRSRILKTLGHMGYFKKGASSWMSYNCRSYPLTIVSSFNVLPYRRFSGLLNQWTLIIHKPLYPQSQGIDNIKTTMEEAYKEIENHCGKKYQGKSGQPRSIIFNRGETGCVPLGWTPHWHRATVILFTIGLFWNCREHL